MAVFSNIKTSLWHKTEIQADSKHSVFCGRKTLAPFFRGGVHWVFDFLHCALGAFFHCALGALAGGEYAPTQKVRSSGIPRAGERADNDQNEMKESVCSSF